MINTIHQLIYELIWFQFIWRESMFSFPLCILINTEDWLIDLFGCSLVTSCNLYEMKKNIFSDTIYLKRTARDRFGFYNFDRIGRVLTHVICEAWMQLNYVIQLESFSCGFHFVMKEKKKQFFILHTTQLYFKICLTTVNISTIYREWKD